MNWQRQIAAGGVSLLGMALLCQSVAGRADNLLHEAPIASARWSLEKSSRVVCLLQHAIPGVGRALFEQRAGESLLFALQSNQRSKALAGAELRVLAPEWRHDFTRQTPLPLHAQTVEGETWLGVHGDDAWRMYQALQRGQQPTFVLQTHDALHALQQISVSPVRFAEAIEAFDDCRANLLPFSFDALNDRTLYFEPGQRKDPTLTDWLRDTGAYLQALPESRVLIYSAVAAQGVSETSSWFKRRAQALADAWRRQGIAAKRIQIRTTPPAETPSHTLRVALFGPEALTSFSFSSKRDAQLTAEEQQRLRVLADYLKDYYRGRLVIDSFVARLGDRNKSLALAERRADTFKRALLKNGIPARRIDIQARAKALSMRQTGLGREIKRYKPPETHRVAIKWLPD